MMTFTSKPLRRLTIPAALALGTWLTACSGGGDADSGGFKGPGGPAEQPGVFRTLAVLAGAVDRGGKGTANGQGTAARFDQPTALAVASDGSLWIGEPAQYRLRRIDPQGQVSTAFDVSRLPKRTTPDGKEVQFGNVQAMVAGPSGEMFIAVIQSRTFYAAGETDEARWVVMRIAPDAEPTLVAVPGPGAIVSFQVAALALDRQGRLIVADRRCSLWRSDGEVLKTTSPRGVQLLHATFPAEPGRACGFDRIEAADHEVTSLAQDGEDRTLFTLDNGDAQRIEQDGRITTIGRVAPGGACRSMAVDRSGRVLLAGGTPALMQMDGTGAEQLVAGSRQQPGWADGPAASARFNTLCAVAIDREGRVVLVDRENHNVRRVAADGSVSTVAGLAEQAGQRDGVGADARFNLLFTLGAGLGNEVLVADRFNGAVRRVDREGRVSTLFAAPMTGDIPGPAYLPGKAVTTADGSVWFSVGATLRVRSPGGTVRTLQDGGLASPLAMALDRNGDVIVAWGSTLIMGRPDASSVSSYFTRYASRTPDAPPQPLPKVVPAELETALKILTPNVSGLCQLADGALAYTQGHAVLRLAADGVVSVLAGNPGVEGEADGPAAAARFRTPSDVACDAAGGVYVADTGNHTVRYIDAQRNVRTSLGTAGRAGHRADAVPGELDSPRSLVLVPGGLVVTSGLGIVRAGF